MGIKSKTGWANFPISVMEFANKLSDEEAGKLFKAVFRYSEEMEKAFPMEPKIRPKFDFAGATQIAWICIKEDIERMWFFKRKGHQGGIKANGRTDINEE